MQTGQLWESGWPGQLKVMSPRPPPRGKACPTVSLPGTETLSQREPELRLLGIQSTTIRNPRKDVK